MNRRLRRRRDARHDRALAQARAAAHTAASGTALAVDVDQDRAARRTWLLLLGGPLGWLAHFATVYLVGEAGCTGGGPGLSAFAPPVPRVVIVVATVLGCLWCAACAWWARSVNVRLAALEASGSCSGTPADGDGRSGGDTGDERWAWASWDPTALLAQVGLLLAGLSALAILFVGVSTPLLPGCR